MPRIIIMAEIKPSFIRALKDANAGFDIEKLRLSYNRKSTLVLDATGLHERAVDLWSTADRLSQVNALAQEYVLFFYLDVNKINVLYRDICSKFQALCEQTFLAPLRAFLTQGDKRLEGSFDAMVASLKKAVDDLDYFVDQGEIDAFFKSKDFSKIFNVKIEEPTQELFDLVNKEQLYSLMHLRDVDKLLEKDQVVQNHFLVQFFLITSFPNLEQTKDSSLLDVGALLAEYYEYLEKIPQRELFGDIPFDTRKRYAWNLQTMTERFPDMTNLLRTVLDYQRHRDHALELSESLSFVTLRQRSQNWKRLENLVTSWFDGDKTICERVKGNYWLSLPATYYSTDWREYLALRALGYDELDCREPFSDVNRNREKENLFYSRDPKYVTAQNTYSKLREAVIVFPSKVKAIGEIWSKNKNPFAKMRFLQQAFREEPPNWDLLVSINWTPTGQEKQPTVSRHLHPLDVAVINVFAMGYFALAVDARVLETQFGHDITMMAHKAIDAGPATSVPVAQKEIITKVMECVDHINTYAMARFYRIVQCRLIDEWFQAPWRLTLLEYFQPLIEAFEAYDKTLKGFSSNLDFVAMPPDQAILDGVYENITIFEKGAATVATLSSRTLPAQSNPPIMSNPIQKSSKDVQGSPKLSPLKIRRSRKAKKGVTSPPIPIATVTTSSPPLKKKKPAASAPPVATLLLSPQPQPLLVNSSPTPSVQSLAPTSLPPQQNVNPNPNPPASVTSSPSITNNPNSMIAPLPQSVSVTPTNVNPNPPQNTGGVPSQYRPQYVNLPPPVTPTQGSTSLPPQQNVSVTSPPPSLPPQPGQTPNTPISVPTVPPPSQPLAFTPNPTAPSPLPRAPPRTAASVSSSQSSHSDSDDDSTVSNKTVIVHHRSHKRPRPASFELFTPPKPLPPGARLYAHNPDDQDNARALMDAWRHYKSPEQRQEEALWRVHNDWEALKKDPTYAERERTCFPEITARVALERTRIARIEADREERKEAIKDEIKRSSDLVARALRREKKLNEKRERDALERKNSDRTTTDKIKPAFYII